MPGRDAPERLGIPHGEPRRIAVGRAQRISANPGFRRFVNQRHVLFPGVRLPHGLPQIVIDELTATGLGEARHQTVVQLRIAPPPLWMVPTPSSLRTSARAKISASSAQNAGMWTPWGS